MTAALVIDRLDLDAVQEVLLSSDQEQCSDSEQEARAGMNLLKVKSNRLLF